jgi:hypothetical protein
MIKRISSLLIIICNILQNGYTQNVGIGTTTPTHARLEINGTVGAVVSMFGADKYGIAIEADNPEIGFNFYYNGGTRTIKAGYAAVMGMYPGSGDLYIGNFNGNQSVTDFGSINDFQQRMIIRQNGKVGIGTGNPGYPLTVASIFNGAGIIQESPDATAQVGFWTATGGAYVQTWTNTDLNFTTGNGVSRMILKTDGNLVINRSMNVLGTLTSPRTGNYNLLPLAYGKIDGSGNILRATANVSVSFIQTGNFRITISGETAMTLNSDKYVIIVTPEASGPGAQSYMATAFIQAGNVIEIGTYEPLVDYSNDNCNCDLFSRIGASSAHSYVSCNFSFIVYKSN